MKKSTLAMALGDDASGGDDGDMPDDSEAADSSEDDSDTDTAITTFLDGKADMATRIAAFRSAVKGCADY